MTSASACVMSSVSYNNHERKEVFWPHFPHKNLSCEEFQLLPNVPSQCPSLSRTMNHGGNRDLEGSRAHGQRTRRTRDTQGLSQDPPIWPWAEPSRRPSPGPLAAQSLCSLGSSLFVGSTTPSPAAETTEATVLGPLISCLLGWLPGKPR